MIDDPGGTEMTARLWEVAWDVQDAFRQSY